MDGWRLRSGKNAWHEELVAMSEWVAIAHWAECVKMERPGIAFEIRNAEGQSMFTPCVVPLPPMPFNWKSPAIEFRPVAQPKPLHSTPLPAPKG